MERGTKGQDVQEERGAEREAEADVCQLPIVSVVALFCVCSTIQTTTTTMPTKTANPTHVDVEEHGWRSLARSLARGWEGVRAEGGAEEGPEGRERPAERRVGQAGDCDELVRGYALALVVSLLVRSLVVGAEV